MHVWQIVAAAVVEVHAEAKSKCLQVPLLAAAKGHRQKGYGSILFGCLGELAEEVGLSSLVVSATSEAAPFWLRQGLHAQAAWPASLRSSVRDLKTHGQLHAFADSLTLGACISDLCSDSEGMVACVLARISRRCHLSRGLSAAEAASALGYEDVNRTGNFWLSESGGKVAVR